MKAFPISLFRLAAMVVLTGSFGHEDVLALPVDLKAQLLESAHSLEVIDAGKLWHGLPGTNQRPGLIADVRNSVEIHVLVNRLTNVGEGFLLGGSLGMAAGKLWTAHGHAVRVLEQGGVPNKVSLHGNQSAPALAQAQAVRVIAPQRINFTTPDLHLMAIERPGKEMSRRLCGLRQPAAAFWLQPAAGGAERRPTQAKSRVPGWQAMPKSSAPLAAGCHRRKAAAGCRSPQRLRRRLIANLTNLLS